MRAVAAMIDGRRFSAANFGLCGNDNGNDGGKWELTFAAPIFAPIVIVLVAKVVILWLSSSPQSYFPALALVFARAFCIARCGGLGAAGQAVHILFILATAQLALYLLGVFDEGLPELTLRRFAPSMSGAALWWFLSLAYWRGRGHR